MYGGKFCRTNEEYLGSKCLHGMDVRSSLLIWSYAYSLDPLHEPQPELEPEPEPELGCEVRRAPAVAGSIHIPHRLLRSDLYCTCLHFMGC